MPEGGEMRDSDTYLAILDEGRHEGRLEEVRKLLFEMGQERFGPPDTSVPATINTLTDLSRLERMIKRLQKASSWQELLSTP